jgi:hypothetical protein
MIEPASEAIPDFTVAGVFGRSLTVFRQEFGGVILLVGLFLIPELLISVALMRMMQSSMRVMPIYRYVVVGMLALQILAQAPVVQMTYARLSGRSARVTDALRESRGRYASAVGVGFLEHLPTLVGIIFFGFQSLILTMAWFATTALFWYVALSVVLIEGKGVLTSLKRSASLTRGHRWRLFGIVLIAAIGPGLAVSFLEPPLVYVIGRYALIFVDFALRIFVISAGTIIGTTTYHSLRTAKEGHALETLSEVFA